MNSPEDKEEVCYLKKYNLFVSRTGVLEKKKKISLSKDLKNEMHHKYHNYARKIE